MRIVAAFVLLQLLGQATGALYAAEQMTCDEASEGDGHEEDCTPGCEQCFCCPHPRLVLLQTPAGFTDLQVREYAFPPRDWLVTEPEPGEIMHVPKAGRFT
jgi:hypothetical protein